jgi:hypothetical protein
MIHVEPTSGTCDACNEKREQRVVAMTVGATTIRLCPECSGHTATTIYDKLSILNSSVPSRDDVTSRSVASFATYPHDMLLNELVQSTVRFHIGPLDADERRIATALLERLAALGIARKVHRSGCEVWPKYRLCNCPWEVPS